MNLQEYRNLQEAYSNVYQEVDEATKMAKLGYDEVDIRNKIAAKTSASGAGKFADKATELADKPTYGDKKKKEGREKFARTQRGDFRDTTSSSPGLRGYGFKSNDPAVKAKQDARGNQRARAALTPNERRQLNMEFDLYDAILAHLLDEGYADTNENALVIMANMSEDWKQSIMEDEYKGDPRKIPTENGGSSSVGSKPKDKLVAPPIPVLPPPTRNDRTYGTPSPPSVGGGSIRSMPSPTPRGGGSIRSMPDAPYPRGGANMDGSSGSITLNKNIPGDDFIGPTLSTGGNTYGIPNPKFGRPQR